MKVHMHVLAAALAFGPVAMAHAQYMPQQDRDRQDQNDQVRQDRDRQGANSESLRGVQDSIHRALPNSSVSAMMQDQNTIVLTGAVANQGEREQAEQIARQQVPNMRVVDQITVGAYGNYPGQYEGNRGYDNRGGSYGSTDRDRDNGNSGYPNRDQDNDNGRLSDRGNENHQVRNDIDNHRQAQTDHDRNNDNDRVKKHNKKDKDKKSKDKDNDDRQPH